MSRIFLVRHGQASFLKKDYDQLSKIGHEQALQLGQYWASKSIHLDQVYTGRLKRQIDTANGCLFGMTQDIKPEAHHGYDEHEGPGIVKAYYPDLFHLDKEIEEKDFDKYRREFYGTYFKLAIPWVNNELEQEKLTDIESWNSFKARFKEAFYHTLDRCESGSTVAIFTSGGPVGAAVGEALSLDDEKTIQLGWQVKNASFSEFLYSRGRLSLVSFNETPHLSSDVLQTLV